jgi:hypothetical protein
LQAPAQRSGTLHQFFRLGGTALEAEVAQAMQLGICGVGIHYLTVFLCLPISTKPEAKVPLVYRCIGIINLI